MSVSPSENILPGAELIGFGYDITVAATPDDVLQRIVVIDTTHGQEVSYGGVPYLLPGNLSWDQTGSSDLNFSTFSSRNEYTSYMSVQTDAEVSAWGFTGSFEATYSDTTEQTTAGLFGLVEANTRMWSVTADSLQADALEANFAKELAALPSDFSLSNARPFIEFFSKYGTHVVSAVVVGGALRYAVEVHESSSYNKVTASAQMQLEYDSVFVDAEASFKGDWNKIDNQWFSSRSVKLLVNGGSPEVLQGAPLPKDAADPVNYSDLVAQWSTSLVKTPGKIRVLLQPISHMVPMERFKALDDALAAYLNSSVQASCTSSVTTGMPFSVGYLDSAITLITSPVEPPNPPKTQSDPSYWIVMADDAGEMTFNANVLSGDPDDFDTLVYQAEDASGDQKWWIAVIVAGAVNPISEAAHTWLATCGLGDIPTAAYPTYPEQIVAVGRTNTPNFAGAIDSRISPFPPNQPVATIEADLPLFAAKVH